MKKLLLALLERDTIPMLTLTEPWATAVAAGTKHNETRSWGTTYEGPLGIHTAKSFPPDAQALCDLNPFRPALLHAGYTRDSTRNTNQWRLPLGQVIAFVWLDHVIQLPAIVTEQHIPSEPERSFGNYGPNRYIWHFSAIYRLKAPVPAQGALGLWRWQPTDSCWQELQAAFDQEIREAERISTDINRRPNSRKAS